MYKTLYLTSFLLLCLIAAACSPSLVGVPITNADYEAAVQEAHDTLDILLRALIAPDPTHRFVGVKARFEGTEVTFEDHWTEPVDFYNNKFTIRILDSLTLNTGLHAEQFVDIPIEDILDWIIVESDGNVLGGYTLRLEYERMTPEQQREYRENTGYKFE